MNARRRRGGGCHCGVVRYEALCPEPLRGMRCNCSICAAKGAVMVYVPRADLMLTSGADRLAGYAFHTHAAQHRFCPVCGIHVFHQTRSDPGLLGINAATLDGVCPYADFPEVPVGEGRDHALDSGHERRIAGMLRFEPGEP